MLVLENPTVSGVTVPVNFEEERPVRGTSICWFSGGCFNLPDLRGRGMTWALSGWFLVWDKALDLQQAFG